MSEMMAALIHREDVRAVPLPDRGAQYDTVLEHANGSILCKKFQVCEELNDYYRWRSGTYD